MSKIIQVVVFEEDPFARSWISLLLSRDRRTRVSGEVREQTDLLSLLKKKNQMIDLVLVDAGLLRRDFTLLTRIDELYAPLQPPVLVVLGMSPDHQILQQMGSSRLRSYLLKDEIYYSIAWAASLAFGGSWVVTPGIQRLLISAGTSLPRPYFVLDGRSSNRNLTDYQSRVARLAFLNSMERRDLSDELGISDEWAYGLVSSLYEKLGLKDLLSDELEPSEYFGDNPQILSFFNGIREEFKGSGKSRDMETLAFHLLSAPDIQEII